MPPRPILESDKQSLKNMIDQMSGLVNLSLDKAMQALSDHDKDLAAKVVADDVAVNSLRYEIEDMGISTIALQQPVAGDLRILMTDIYVATELERIADHAVSIAKTVLKLENAPGTRFIQPVVDIADKCKSMLLSVMQAYDNSDEQLARDIAGQDDEIDNAENVFSDYMLREMCSQPEHPGICTYLLSIAHNLERIGDRVTNIAERVVYMAASISTDLNH